MYQSWKWRLTTDWSESFGFHVRVDIGEGLLMKKFNKLVRDKIPVIIEASGKKAEMRVLDDAEYKKMLDVKLQEELYEYITAVEEKD